MVKAQTAMEEVTALLGEYQPKFEALQGQLTDVAEFTSVRERVQAD